MIGIRTNVFSPTVNAAVIPREASKCADLIADTVKNHVKLALTARGKIATGKTLKSIKTEFIVDSPSRGQFIRNVVGAKSWLNIQYGRKAGKKMPVVRVSGATKGGGALFMPVPDLLAWFEALNIPRRRWFPIMRAIAKRGIKPVDIRDKAVADSRPRIGQITQATGQAIARDLFGGQAQVFTI